MGDILLLKYPSVCSVYKAEGRFSVFINQGFLRFSLMPRVPESLPADVRLVFRHSHIHKPDHRAEQRQGELIPVFQFPHGFPHLTRHSAHGLRSAAVFFREWIIRIQFCKLVLQKSIDETVAAFSLCSSHNEKIEIVFLGDCAGKLKPE